MFDFQPGLKNSENFHILQNTIKNVDLTEGLKLNEYIILS